MGKHSGICTNVLFFVIMSIYNEHFMIINDSEIPYDQAVKGTFIVLLIEFDIEETLDRGPLKARISNR